MPSTIVRRDAPAGAYWIALLATGSNETAPAPPIQPSGVDSPAFGSGPRSGSDGTTPTRQNADGWSTMSILKLANASRTSARDAVLIESISAAVSDPPSVAAE